VDHGADLPGSQTSAALGALGTGKVRTLAFIQYTCLFNHHLTIRPIRKGPDGSKPIMTWLRLSGNQSAVHWMFDKTHPSLPKNILH